MDAEVDVKKIFEAMPQEVKICYVAGVEMTYEVRDGKMVVGTKHPVAVRKLDDDTYIVIEFNPQKKMTYTVRRDDTENPVLGKKIDED
jgi:hypothetical protein